MRKLGWYAVCAAMGVFVLGSLGLFAANLYVQSHAVQQRIRLALAAALRTPVSLRKTTVTPWDGVRLDGVALRGENTGRGDGSADLLTAASFRVRLAWWPLLTQRRLIVEQALLDRPRLVLREKPDSLLAQESSPPEPPAAPAAVTPVVPATPSVAGEPFPPATPAPSATVDVEPRRPPAAAKMILPPVKKLRVRHGEISSLDHSGHPQFQVEEINADASVTDPQHARGAVWFARATGGLPGAALTDYWTAVDYDDQAGLAVRDGHGNLAGGTLTTDFRLRPQESRWFFTSAGKLANVALGRLTRAEPEQAPLAEGQLHGDVDLRGFTDDSASIAGGGRLWLDGARLRNFPLVKLIGQVLRIADLSQLEFKQAQMDYRVADNALHVDALTLVSNDGQVVLRGQYLMAEDRLDFHGRLTIDHAISHQLPQFIESNFVLCGDESPGCRYLDFDVTGTRDDPKCNLYDRLTAGPMKGLLDNLLAPRPKSPKTQRQDGAKKQRPSVGNPLPKP